MFHCVPIAFRNFSSAPGPLRELEAEQPLVLDAAAVAADHVAHVQLRHLVVAHVDDRIAGLRAATASSASFSLRPSASARPTNSCAAAPSL